MDGVEAVFTGKQIAEFLAPMPIGTPFPSPEHRAVAVDTVRFSGEPVAVVVARDRYVARDAADAILVSYDPLPAVVDVEQAMTGQPTVIHPDFKNNLAVPFVPSGTGVSADGSKVDDSAIEAAFAKADVVISQRMVNQRLAPNAMTRRLQCRWNSLIAAPIRVPPDQSGTARDTAASAWSGRPERSCLVMRVSLVENTNASTRRWRPVSACAKCRSMRV